MTSNIILSEALASHDGDKAALLAAIDAAAAGLGKKKVDTKE